jgi:hypothetical protein
LPTDRSAAARRRIEQRLRAIPGQVPGVRVVIGGDLPTRRAVAAQTAADLLRRG